MLDDHQDGDHKSKVSRFWKISPNLIDKLPNVFFLDVYATCGNFAYLSAHTPTYGGVDKFDRPLWITFLRKVKVTIH